MKAQTNGIETYYELHGKEGMPWLVLSHSLACSTRMWDEQIAAFKERYRILGYDTRGRRTSVTDVNNKTPTSTPSAAPRHRRRSPQCA